jgi:hypothetical protein
MDSNVSGAVSLTSMSRLKDIPEGYASAMMVDEGVETQRLKSEKRIRGEGSLSAQNNSKSLIRSVASDQRSGQERKHTTGAGKSWRVCDGMPRYEEPPGIGRRCLSATLKCGVEQRMWMTSSLVTVHVCIKSETC